MKLWKSFLFPIGLLGTVGCDQAPLSVTSFASSESIQSNTMQVHMEYLLREGRYCGLIKIGKDGGKSLSDTNKYFNEKVKVSYEISIPDIDFSEKVDLGVFDEKNYGGLYEGSYAFHQFTINVENPPSYRAHVFLNATLEGNENILEESKFGVGFSEWGCK